VGQAGGSAAFTVVIRINKFAVEGEGRGRKSRKRRKERKERITMLR
jgi:hypothetical protein